ncbi:uncharacterized protein LALA0_S07e02784g [Lachancea lanzarotensis]|uniref:LALA0S07e02784g1_1 n=1 Tax=Lachancea lanzarotensis TaxID=1245769 RepID=A0A0C7N5B1_9SACH|nr:uncharacterized protein LALA0_S07e02784g [Lachancea lanzarotensis]CEP63118.1 LALA0S07e02784g1_1 [Lachancea lanzarotensis]
MLFSDVTLVNSVKIGRPLLDPLIDNVLSGRNMNKTHLVIQTIRLTQLKAFKQWTLLKCMVQALTLNYSSGIKVLTQTCSSVARRDLYNEDNDSAASSTKLEEEMTPKFEFVTVDQTSETQGKDIGEGAMVEEEVFDFPLFSFGGNMDIINDRDPSDDLSENQERSRGRNPTRLIKVSLREESPDLVQQERPRSYYFADFSQDDIKRFRISAIDYEVAIQDHTLPTSESATVDKRFPINLDQHNKKIEAERLRELKVRRRRPGKKQREARKQGAERLKQRLQSAKDVKKLVKKKFHKRGGKKNHKTTEMVAK